MATAPSITISSVSAPLSSAPPKSIDLLNTDVTVGDPAETTVRYYTGPWDTQATNTHMALELTTDTSGRLPGHVVSYGDSIQYNQRFGLRAVVSNSAGLSSTDQLQYTNLYFLDEPQITSSTVNNGDGTKTTVFALVFDNGAAAARVRVGYSVAEGKVTNWGSSEWGSWKVSNQETISVGATGTQTLHFTVTTPVGADNSYKFLLRANHTNYDDAHYWSSGYQDYTRAIYYTPGMGNKLYGASASKTKLIRKLYGGVRELTSTEWEIESGGLGNVIGFDRAVFVQGVREKIDNNRDLAWAEVTSYSSESGHAGEYGLVVGYSDSASPQTVTIVSYISNTLLEMYYGIRVRSRTGGTDRILLTPEYTIKSKKIDKLYGSSASKTVLTHRELGHFDYVGYGQVVYYTDDGHTGTTTGTLRTLSEVARLNGRRYTNIKVDGVTVKEDNVKSITLNSRVTEIPGWFGYNWKSLESVDISNTRIVDIPCSFLRQSSVSSRIILPTTVKTIGEYFLGSCKSYNFPTTFHEGITFIDGGCLFNCNTFNQNVTLPSTLTFLGSGLLNEANKMCSTVDVGNLPATIAEEGEDTFGTLETYAQQPIYAIGISIAGANRAAWRTRFPDIAPGQGTLASIRHTVDAGY